GRCGSGGIVFFFSSRRRHTRLVSDWSSDVCSSDLERCLRHDAVWRQSISPDMLWRHTASCRRHRSAVGKWDSSRSGPCSSRNPEIGRGSCREKGWRLVGGQVVTNKTIEQEGKESAA